jgi:peptide deformylase
MAVLKIIEWPEKVLETRAQEVVHFDADLCKLVQDMHDTLDHTGALGLAANQVGVLQRVVVMLIPFRHEEEERMWWHDKRFTFINPVIKKKVGRATLSEGCLSFPGIYEYIERADEVTVEAFDEHGKKFEISGVDYFSACVQHEVDHLDGIVFVNRMSRLKATLVRKKLQKQLLMTQGE